MMQILMPLIKTASEYTIGKVALILLSISTIPSAFPYLKTECLLGLRSNCLFFCLIFESSLAAEACKIVK